MYWLVVFAAGAAGGALCDQIHIQSGVLSYPHPTFADQAWWVGPQFGVAMVLLFVGVVPFARWAAKVTTARNGALGADIAWFLGAYLASGVWHAHPAALAGAYGVAWVARLAARPDRVPVAVFCVLLAIIGVVYEGTLAGSGAFSYAHPDFYNVPVWLAGIYLHGGPLAITVARRLRPANMVA